MAAGSITFHPEAVLEARAAREWYRERSEAAADGFVAELDAAIAQILASPDRWPAFIPPTRRFLFRRYPFFVVYQSTADAVQIFAVAHGHRRPGYWRNRI